MVRIGGELVGIDIETRVRKKSLSRFYVWQHQPRSSEGGRPQTALPRRRLRPPPPAHPALPPSWLQHCATLL